MPNYKTPGVYITEINAFPNSVVEVPTAVPAFVGYTESATFNQQSCLNKPVKITSMAEFRQYFGGSPNPEFRMSAGTGGKKYTLSRIDNHMLYYNMRFFFANGGGPCYVVSVGSYNDTITKESLLGGLQAIAKEQEPTLLVIPEAVCLDADDCYSLQTAMLQQCGQMQDRFAILDIYNGFKDRDNTTDDVINSFRNSIGINALNYGAAYYPWVNTDVTSEGIGTQNITEGAELLANLNKDELTALNAELLQIINLLPPSAGMAGVYTQMDNYQGVWNAPANTSIVGAISPAVAISDMEQGDLNVPVNGKAVNAIRNFPGRGVVIWGARTLDGNSQDWRYINIRRTMIMIEQSVKQAVRSYVFEPNTANTWASVKSMIENFLTNLWKEGALMGAKPSDAFSVQVGLGSTMTANDILEGIMNVTILVAVVRPAEFIVITLQQQMQKE